MVVRRNSAGLAGFVASDWLASLAPPEGLKRTSLPAFWDSLAAIFVAKAKTKDSLDATVAPNRAQARCTLGRTSCR